MATQNVKTYNNTCSKCSQPYRRDIRIEEESILNDSRLTDQEKTEKCASNIEKAFCPDCTVGFIKWMAIKGYLKTDCWCSHVEEYKKGAEVGARRDNG